MTPRQLQLLALMKDDIVNGRIWSDRVLTCAPRPGQQLRITWEEMLWLLSFEMQACLTRIEAAEIVAKAAA